MLRQCKEPIGLTGLIARCSVPASGGSDL
jgi:hypothetical protein